MKKKKDTDIKDTDIKTAKDDLAYNNKKKSVGREYAEAIVIALLLALFIRAFIVQAFKIPSGSMENTLLVGDHILVSKFIYGIKIPNEIPFTQIKLFNDIRFFSHSPKRGDIIVFRYPMDKSRDFIKRVIGLPGEQLEIRGQEVYINGEPLKETHVIHNDPNPHIVHSLPRDYYGPVTIPEGSLFVMGDNRENSRDSRYWGFLDIKEVKGKAFIIYWSWDKERFGIRWDRFGKLLH
ncbi:MAG: signal peptidase I [Nitrospinae bacterium]|nr:signal peptidase I [Nitrospinota bacterium]